MSLYDTEDFDEEWEVDDYNPMMDEFWSYENDQSSGIDLISADYNLNSPLIKDEVDAIFSWVWTDYMDPRFEPKNENRFLRKVLRSYSSAILTFKNVDSFHSWFAKEVMLTEFKETEFEKFNKWMATASPLSVNIAEKFLNKFSSDPKGNSNIRMLKRGILSDQLSHLVKSDFERFHMFHQMIMLMNSTEPRHRQNIVKSRDYMYQQVKEYESNKFIVEGSSPTMGQFVLVPGFVWFQDHHRLIDRNMLLMMKDLNVARFSSKMSIVGNPRYGEYDLYFVNALYKFYTSGDRLIESCGNDVFDAIKLIEPACNLRMIQLADRCRPLIPENINFQEHVRMAILDFESKYRISLRPFFDKILTEDQPELVVLYFGAYRHFGHPFLDYIEGLKKLHDQVTKDTPIDEKYAELIASDLARKVLREMFSKEKRWFVDIEKMERDHPFYHNVKHRTWPSPAAISNFGDEWHKLPLTECFQVPSGVHPSVLYSDKSHSMDKDLILDHVRKFPYLPIPSKKVLKTALGEEDIDLKSYLQNINDNSIPDNELVIGLKGKEREVKRIGRFFSLMSWNLRTYFVLTEHLIKKFYVPLFNGLTMADDFTTVIKKLLDRVVVQGSSSYDKVCFANHFDYSKWNNTQRGKANNPVFSVMGRFLGYPELFTRTHEFFERSLIYYNDRADLMRVENHTLVNKGKEKVCWQGQLGGLEGLRQKGWSIVNLLVLEREGRVRNTEIKVLAQGDNQVVCTYYDLASIEDTSEHLLKELDNISRNNVSIINAIIKGTTRLGLTLNLDETMVTHEFLNYGKTILFRGNMLPILTKRWSRINCITNDQIPTFSNILQTVSTNALTVCMSDITPTPSIYNYVYFGLFCLYHLAIFSPLLGQRISHLLGENTNRKVELMCARLLYVDPSLGGVSGTSLTRFLIRQFPDAVCESLSFWKFLHGENLDRLIDYLCVESGHPHLGKTSTLAFERLMENPTCLNIPHVISSETILKEAVKEQLILSVDTIKSSMFRESIKYMNEHETDLIEYLMSITPLFPRFLSELRASTFIGITTGLVGLFQNSRTIRGIFKKKFATVLYNKMITSEESNLKLMSRPKSPYYTTIWDCSASLADDLRIRSWGKMAHGTTVPHPIEMLGKVLEVHHVCGECQIDDRSRCYVSVSFPQGFKNDIYVKGPLPPYLGSSTQETTTLFHPWEKDTDIPILDRATGLRNTINWFVEKGSGVARTIMANLKALTGLDWDEDEVSFERTGSALHRFKCSRQSSGGYVSVSHNLLSYTFTTTDAMGELNEINHDFMFQSVLLYCQLASICHQMHVNQSITHHYHINCKKCIRPIQEIKLVDNKQITFTDVSHLVQKISGQNINLVHKAQMLRGEYGNWGRLNKFEKSFHIGVSQGVAMGVMHHNHDPGEQDHNLFPNMLTKKVYLPSYMLGLLRGLKLGSLYTTAYHRYATTPRKRHLVLEGSLLYLISRLTDNVYFLNSINRVDMRYLMRNIPHRIPPSYPQTRREIGLNMRSFFEHHSDQKSLNEEPYLSMCKTLWIFSDFRTPKWVGLLSCCHYLQFLDDENITQAEVENKLRQVKFMISYFSAHYSREDDDSTEESDNYMKTFLSTKLTRHILFCSREVRHAAGGIEGELDIEDSVNTEFKPPLESEEEWDNPWREDFKLMSLIIPIEFELCKKHPPMKLKNVGYFRDPLISGLRPAQLATGAHYKLTSMIQHLSIPKDILCIGDGSGGISACLLRHYSQSRLIFNSLMDGSGSAFFGVTPSPPSALAAMPTSVRSRCVNLFTCWSASSDLTEQSTWEYFISLIEEFNLDVDLIVCDMEPYSIGVLIEVVRTLMASLNRILSPKGTILIKIHISQLNDSSYLRNVEALTNLFVNVNAIFSQMSSSKSSECYLKCTGLKTSYLIKRMYWTRESILRLVDNCFATQSLEDEFHRATILRNTDLTKGIPIALMPDPILELSHLLVNVGLETGTSKVITNDLCRIPVASDTDITLRVLCLLCVTSNSSINITWARPGYGTLPSMGDIQTHFGLFIGVWLYVAWVTNNVQLYKIMYKWIDDSYINYKFKLYKRNGLNFMSWNWNGPGKVGKCIYKAKKLDLAASIIRAFSRIWPGYKCDIMHLIQDIKQLDQLMGRYNQGLNVSRILHYTGLLDPLGLTSKENEYSGIYHSFSRSTYQSEKDVQESITDDPRMDSASWVS